MTDLLGRVAANTFEDFDPAVLIAAVNDLLPLGKDAVIAETEAYVREFRPGEETSGILWLLRVLFDTAPPRPFPPFTLGRPSVPPPPDPQVLPRFPIVIAADVPLLLIRGYDAGGVPEPFGSELAFVRQHAGLRNRPLVPSADEAEAAFLRQWTAAYGMPPAADEREFIAMQINRLRPKLNRK